MISYPLSLPSGTRTFRSLRIRNCSTVGLSVSPFTFEQQAFVWEGEYWTFEAQLPPMKRALAEAWIAWRLALNGREGTFLAGDPSAATPRGSWAGGSPLVQGGGQSGKVLSVDGLVPFATVAAGDWLQLGSGSGSHLYKISQAGMADSGGTIALDIWPRLRSSPADNDPVVIQAAKGLWRLADNMQEWSVDLAIYGLTLSAMEAR